MSIFIDGVPSTTDNNSGPTYTPSTSAVMEAMDGPLVFDYQTDDVTFSALSASIPMQDLSFEILAGVGNPIVPGSVWFEWDGDDYIDRDGIIYKNHSVETGVGTAVGNINYLSGVVTFATWNEGANLNITLNSCVTRNGKIATDLIAFRTPGAPLRPSSLQVTATALDGDVLTATAEGTGAISGSGIVGGINVENGVGAVQFPKPVDPGSIRYNTVLYSYLPMDADLIGLDPVRLPSDGRVPIYRRGYVVVISHTDETNLGTPTAGQVANLSRDHQTFIEVRDANDKPLKSDQYTVDLNLGRVTFSDPLSLIDAEDNALAAPFKIVDRIEHMSVCNEAQITGDLSIIAPCPHDFPVGSLVSSALTYGDISAKWNHFFTQRNWNGGAPNWTDERVGDDTTAKFNLIDSPVEVYNNGAINEKWVIIFTSGSTFEIFGQSIGGIPGSYSTNADCAPVNPNTGQPYFILKAAGWGTGWTSGNAVRFNTESCLAPVWVIRTTTPGQGLVENDQFTLQSRGDF